MTPENGSGAHRAAAAPPGFTPGERIRLARENLCLAMSLFAASHQGLITTSFVHPAVALRRPTGEVIDSYARLELPDDPALVRCAGNQVRGAFVLSVLQTERELAGRMGEPSEPHAYPTADADLSPARCAVYLLARSVERSLIAPVWDVPAAFARRYAVSNPDFTLEAAGLDGLEVRWEHFGGLPRYLDLTLYLSRRLDGYEYAAGSSDSYGYGAVERLAARPSAEAAASGPAAVRPGYGAGAGRRHQRAGANPSGPGFSSGNDAAAGWIPPDGSDAPPIVIAASAAAPGPVDDFVSDACATGGKAMTLAGELYTCYARWCLDNGYLAVSQRKFGLELAAGGYERKRRGKGKHWWMGLQPRD